MKRFVVVGLGGFGFWVARELHQQGFDVIAIDKNPELADRCAPFASHCVAADATDPDTLRRAGAEAADAGIVSTGDDLAASILAILALRDVGVEQIYAKISGLQAARALERFDLADMVFPERESATRLARRLTSSVVLDYIPLGGEYSIQELAIPDPWIGKTLRELSLRKAHGVQVVALFDVLTGVWTVAPDPDKPLMESDVAVVAGNDRALTKLLAKAR
jgi:trk system potassium uptake protein TrkA